jgi:DNA-binding transcriptional LysR family regulator
MNLNQLVTFSVVAECGQISRAAEELFIAQPAVSRQIRALEEELGVSLFERHRGGRQLTLTYAGEILLNHVRVLLGEVAHTRRRMDEVKRGAAGLIRIAAGPVILRYVVTPAVAKFRRDWPDTDLRVIEAEYESVFSLVEDGTADLAVGVVLPDMLTLQWEDLYNARLYALVSPTHRLATRPHLEAEELAIEELLLLKTGGSARLTL